MSKSNAEKVLSGEFRPTREGKQPEEVETERFTLQPLRSPEPPELMPDVGKAAWRSYFRVLEENDIEKITELDLPIIEIYFYAYARRLDAERNLQDDGLIDVDPETGKVTKSPYIDIIARCEATMEKFGQQLGIGAISRQRIDVLPKAKGESADDDWV